MSDTAPGASPEQPLARGVAEHTGRFVTVIAALAAVAGFLFGYDTGVISGVIVLVKHEWRLSTALQSIVVSAVLVGAILGAAAAGKLADRYGRRRTLIAAAAVFFVGSLGTALAANTAWLIGGRVIIGVAIGFASSIAPLYIAEIAPPERRGSLVSLNQLAITIGILGSYAVDRAFADVDNGWRYMFALGVIPALVLGIGMLFVPESPRWLVRRGRFEQARHVLVRVVGRGRADQELADLQASVAGGERGSLRELLVPWLRPALIIGIGLMFFQQFTGINTVIYYAPTIFEMAGFDSAGAAISATVIIGVVNVVFTIVSLWLIDRVGRKPLLYVGLSGMSLSLVVLGVAFAEQAALGGSLRVVAVGSLVAYVAAFAVSLGPIAWLVMSEIYPLNVRGTAVGLATLSNWAFNFIVAVTFLLLIDGVGRSGAFWLYAGVGVLGLVFTRLYVPETKGVTLEDIEEHWRAGGRPVDLGRGRA
jgi:sugar porter (SP) family MFS transporter